MGIIGRLLEPLFVLGETYPTLAKILFFLMLILVLPSGISWLLCRGTGMQILQAYGIWIALILLLCLGGPSRQESIGWFFIILTMLSIFGVPVLVFGLKLVRWLKWV